MSAHASVQAAAATLESSPLTLQRQAGLGLGLFIVRTLVRRNGGDVVAESDGTGLGSRFRVELRAAPGGVPALATARPAVEGA